ncbi:hypothetical protein RF679_06930 [Undibacterium cyanobacteriorum]|uniref:Uncharacterized protein n=1 Tax=Undibacterium cyanobacteriorum TaxID=3073561 RepID=A0ABY9RLC0_9BURK|nr:hypothetical protein [Undibacterium sp. 20NA77.5]WMW82013.1 hypothetical protein RF679_06930 [Undibacterium sp. 20NA77.5]
MAMLRAPISVCTIISPTKPKVFFILFYHRRLIDSNTIIKPQYKYDDMTTASIHADFLVKSPGQRGLALLLAVLLTVGVLLQLSLSTPLGQPTREGSRELIINWVKLQAPPAELPRVDLPPISSAISSTPRASKLPKKSEAITAPKISESKADTIAPTTEKALSFDSVSENLKREPTPNLSGKRFDSNAVRQAYEDSKSDIQKRAEASGNSLEGQRLTKHERFQEAAKAATKPDCLRQGASILSIFVVAYQAATDHCK